MPAVNEGGREPACHVGAARHLSESRFGRAGRWIPDDRPSPQSSRLLRLGVRPRPRCTRARSRESPAPKDSRQTMRSTRCRRRFRRSSICPQRGHSSAMSRIPAVSCRRSSATPRATCGAARSAACRIDDLAGRSPRSRTTSRRRRAARARRGRTQVDGMRVEALRHPAARRAAADARGVVGRRRRARAGLAAQITSRRCSIVRRRSCSGA